MSLLVCNTFNFPERNLLKAFLATKFLYPPMLPHYLKMIGNPTSSLESAKGLKLECWQCKGFIIT